MSPRYHWKRRASQTATIMLFALIPACGLFRIDLTSASFVILDRQIWWAEFFVIFGLMIVLATAPILTYLTIGTVWCGWSCPQNTLSEWADGLTRKLLGKRASVDIASAGLNVARAKNKAANWIALTLAFLGVSLLLGVIPFLYFFPPELVWSFLTFRLDSSLSRFMRPLYMVCVVAVFLDIAVIRYFWCKYACLYRIGQLIFKTGDALHVAYDSARSSDCTKCNYCASSCIIDINPTNPAIADGCINCGECIDACDGLHEKVGTHGLLRFEFGEKRRGKSVREGVSEFVSKFNWVGVIFLIGCSMLVWGILN